MKFSIKDFFSKCVQIRRKLYFLCSVVSPFDSKIVDDFIGLLHILLYILSSFE